MPTSTSLTINVPNFCWDTVSNWQLPASRVERQRLPLRVIYPRPDSETNSFDLHRKASVNHTYRTRIVVQGGSMPFKMELINAPAGAAIVGEFIRVPDLIVPARVLHIRPDDYGVVSWNSDGSNATFEVLITDQTGAKITAAWTVQTDETAFVYVDAVSGNDANDGSFATPLQTFNAGLYEADQLASTYQGKIACFKAGTYQIGVGVTNAFPGIDINKPRSYVGIETGVIFDTSAAHFYGNTDAISMHNIAFDGVLATVGNVRLLQVSSKGSNYFFDSLSFRNQSTVGTSGNDNPACIVFLDDVNYGYNVAVVNCVLESTCKFQLVCTFTTDGAVFEGNSALAYDPPASNGARFLHAKDDTKNVSIRFNKADVVNADCVSFSNQQHSFGGAANQEACYNFFTATGRDFEHGIIEWNLAALQGGVENAANTHQYRNTLVSNTYCTRAEKWNGGADVQISGDIWDGFAYLYSQLNRGYALNSPLPEKITAAQDIDGNGALTNTNNKRTELIGVSGWEICS